jgi:DNA-directed RNA polymerase alpha subunit
MFTAEQLLRLRNFGQKSLDEVKHALEQHSFSLHIGPPEPRLLLSFPRVDG